MIESLTSGEIKEIRDLLKKVDEKLAEGMRIHDLRETKTRTEMLRNKFDHDKNPYYYHRFFDTEVEIYLDFIQRKNGDEYYVLTTTEKKEGEKDKTGKEFYKRYSAAAEGYREAVRKYLNQKDMVLF